MKKLYTPILALLSVYAFAQSGTLDPSFADNGKIHTGFTEASCSANTVAVQSDGKIIIAGYAHTANSRTSWERDSDNFILVRYNPDGSIDPAFGFEGKVMTDFYPFYTNNLRNSMIYTIKLQPDGKILAYGAAGTETVVARYNTDGSIDSGFGGNGMIRCNSSPVDGGNTLVVQPDGKIAVLGTQWTQPSANVWNTQFVVERFNPDGSADASFGDNGRVVTSFLAGYNMPKEITMQPDGKIVAVGTSSTSLNYLVAARYTTNGALDTSFDSDGKVMLPIIGSVAFATVNNDGKIVIAATTFSSTVGPATTSFTLYRFNTNGSPDTGFDGDGIASSPFEDDDESNTITSVISQGDGKFLVTTTADIFGSDETEDAFTVRRYNNNGTVDTSFGTNGKVATMFQPGYNIAKSLAVQPNGDILAVGYSHPLLSAQNSPYVTRYLSNGSLDTGFGTGGRATAKFDATNDESSLLLVRPDGRLIAIGTKRNATENGNLYKEIALSGYTADGSPDTSFGNGGRVISSSGNNINTPACAVLQQDGKILVANTYYNIWVDNLTHYELLRYTVDGAIDNTFGTAGKVVVDTDVAAMLSQPDGKIITLSMAYDSQNNASLVVRRYNSNGTPDTGFGSNGMAGIAAANILGPVLPALQADGKIIISYSTFNTDGAVGLSSIRFNANGTIDNEFSAGVTIIDNGTYANGVFIQPDGRIIVTARSIGMGDGSPFYRFVAARYNTNGSPDTTYGNNGIVAAYMAGTADPYREIKSVVRQPDGKFVVALSKLEPDPAHPNPDSYDIVIARFTEEGSFDNEFGTDGQVTASFYNKYDEAFSIVLQADNKIVVGGITDTGINRDFALLRYNNNVTLGTSGPEASADLLLYPNPVKNVLNLGGTDAGQVTGYCIYDMLGKRVDVNNGANSQISTASLSPGIYTIRITTEKGIINRKFVRE